MATPYRFGSAMLSRVATPSTCLRARPFSTSLLRAADDSAHPRRSNPLVGNYARTPKPEPVKASTLAPERPKSFQPRSRAQTPASTIVADAPPPPPPAAEEASPAENSDKEHPYTAAKPAANAPFNLDIASLVASKAGRYGRIIETDIMSRPQIRAKPVTGRTIFVKERNSTTSSTTPMGAIRVLNRTIREQQVKNKFHSQKFHERNGLKKKRLRSERWRARFKTGFVAAVQRVVELKKQGW